MNIPVSESCQLATDLSVHFHRSTLFTLDKPTAMAPSDELEYLKSLVNQLNDKIKSLEERAKSAVKPQTPAQQLRTILVGPPGSGSSQLSRVFFFSRIYRTTRDFI